MLFCFNEAMVLYTALVRSKTKHQALCKVLYWAFAAHFFYAELICKIPVVLCIHLLWTTLPFSVFLGTYVKSQIS